MIVVTHYDMRVNKLMRMYAWVRACVCIHARVAGLSTEVGCLKRVGRSKKVGRPFSRCIMTMFHSALVYVLIFLNNSILYIVNLVRLFV